MLNLSLSTENASSNLDHWWQAVEGVTETQLEASIYRSDFYEFLQHFWSVIVVERPVFNWHVEFLCRELQRLAMRVAKEEVKEYDLIINIPPGTTKSTICSQMFPAWVWTFLPQAKFICGSYSHQVALKDSLKTRDIVLSQEYQRLYPYVTLREDENTKGLFTNRQGGFRLSVATGGLATGYHAHFIIIDDPLNPEESYSEAHLAAATRWIRQTLLSRKVNAMVTPMILIQQRLHQHDPSGELLANDPSGYRHICLPAELTDKVSPPELAEKYQDGLLDPIRLPREVLRRYQVDLGHYGYSAQILQDPVPLGGGMFEVEKIQVVLTPPLNIVRKVRAWDKAGTTDGGAYSVGVLFGVDDQRRYWILDVRRGQWNSAKREQIIRETAEEDGEEVEILVEIEGGSGGKESGENTAANLAGFSVHLLRPTGTKEARAYPLASQIGAGTVGMVKAPWNRELLDEFRAFPASRFKDQVDACSMAFNFLAKKKKRIGALW
jgi:predicted phage terminase large subunit-like protein